MEMTEAGYTIIDDFLPIDVANKLEQLYSTETDWDKIYQYRENHYSHVFKNDSLYFPDENEAYSAKFSRSSRLELKISDIFEEYFKPELLRVSKKHLKHYDFRCDKLEIGDYYRTHIDDYAGAIGSIYYFNKKWCWDWGGILHIGDNDDSLISIFPKFNRMIFLNHEKFKFMHFISPVTDYAKNVRYSIISFNK